MAVTPRFTRADVERRFANFLDIIEKKQIERLQYLGEMCIKQARLTAPSVGFTDQTGNLRSSIGYVIFKNGSAIRNNYEQVKEGKEGTQKGQEVAKKAAAKYPQGIVLVITAGMNYAVYLESKGRDVLTSAELLAAEELPKMLEKLISNINRATE